MNLARCADIFRAVLINLSQRIRAQRTTHIPAVRNFNLERYVGLWYEIARLPHPFEEGISHATATYGIYPDHTVSVVNRGYRDSANKWVEIHGAARMKADPNVGELEVSFFRPFLSRYRIIYIDNNYNCVMITSNRLNRLWIMARSPHLESETLANLCRQAKSWGFDTSKLIFVDHR